jgi:hypothetical protein
LYLPSAALISGLRRPSTRKHFDSLGQAEGRKVTSEDASVVT